MPYSVPGVVAPPPPTAPPYAPPRPSHRRSYTFAANDPTNHGAFTPLGSLPRRSRSPAQFHFRADEDDSSESSDDKHDDEDDGPPPPLRLKQPQPAFRLTPPTTYVRKRSPPSSSINVAVPFPRSSPVPSPTLLSPLPTPQRPAGPARTASHPVILLSNGKPLKSSLKSSSSAPHMSAPSQHLRARSAPSTPSLSSSLSSLASSSASNSDAEDDQNPWDQMGGDGSPFSPGTPKAVHFPAPSEGLETVLLFRRGARPAAVSLGSVVPGSEDTETETETDRDVGVRWRSASLGNGGRAAGDGEGFPFPRLAAGGSPLRPPIPSQFMAQAKPWRYALDGPALVGRVPGRESMVFLESAELCQPSFSTTREGEVKLKGTLIARNAAFEKHVYVRFTLDGWSTTSEVCAKWLEAVTPQEEEAGPGWDRFTWEIRLTDYAAAGGRRGRGLEGRRLEMVVRVWMPWVERGSVAPYVWSDSLVSNPHAASQSKYWVGTGGGGSGEWWDNNGGTNYVVVFQVVHDDEPAPPPPAPVVTPPAKVEESTVSVIPFPTSGGSMMMMDDAPAAPVFSPTISPTHSHSSFTGPHTPPYSTSSVHPSHPTHPPPPPRSAHAQALAAKLGKLQLRNYAAPTKVSPPAAVPETKPVGLYWPWGTSSTPPPAPAPVEEEDDASSVASSTLPGDDTPPTSPVGAGAVLKVLFDDAADVPLPPSPEPDVEMETTPTTALTPSVDDVPMSPLSPAGADASSSLYKAFLQQWCFAGAGGAQALKV